MKVVWTFIMITFIVTLVLSLGGVAIDSGKISTPVGTVDVSTLGILNGIFSGDILNSALITYLLITIIGTMAAVAITNAVTGGNASVGITFGYSLFAVYCFSLLMEYINLISYTRTTAHCAATTMLACGDIGVGLIYFYGVILVVGFAFSIVDLVGGND